MKTASKTTMLMFGIQVYIELLWARNMKKVRKSPHPPLVQGDPKKS